MAKDPDAPRHGQKIGGEVLRCAGVDGAHGAHQTVGGVGVAADHRLDALDNGGGGDDDVHAPMGRAPVAGTAMEGNGEIGLFRHEGTGGDGDGPGRELGTVMDPKDPPGLFRKAGPEAVVQQEPGSAGGLLRGLEEEDDAAGQRVPQLGQQYRRPVEPGGVEVVAAGVHDAGVLRHHRAPFRRVLDDGVDVGPEGHQRAGPAAPQQGRRAGGHAQVHQFHRQGGELLLQKRGGAHLPAAELRMAVQVVLEDLEDWKKGLGPQQQIHSENVLSLRVGSGRGSCPGPEIIV